MCMHCSHLCSREYSAARRVYQGPGLLQMLARELQKQRKHRQGVEKERGASWWILMRAVSLPAQANALELNAEFIHFEYAGGLEP
jgi:hypothetical protein